MSYEHGWAALHLDMPPRVPRTEYSADSYHFDLMAAVTGVPVRSDSPADLKEKASRAFVEAWNYDLFWATDVGGAEFGALHTDMGHAEYAADGSDLRVPGPSLFPTVEAALAFDPWEAYGSRSRGELARRFEDAYKARCASRPTGVNMSGVYTTCLSGLIEILGWEMLLLAAGTDPARFGDLARRYSSWTRQYFEALAEADVPVVMVHDDIVWSSGPFLRPSWYREHVFPGYKENFAPLLESGKKVLFTSDGNYTEFVDDLVECGVHGLVMEPMTDMAYVAAKYGRTHVFIGNADTRVLLAGPRSAIRAEVERCMAIGKRCPGYLMAVGNHIPANTPVENCIYYNQVYEELSRR